MRLAASAPSSFAVREASRAARTGRGPGAGGADAWRRSSPGRDGVDGALHGFIMSVMRDLLRSWRGQSGRPLRSDEVGDGHRSRARRSGRVRGPARASARARARHRWSRGLQGRAQVVEGAHPVSTSIASTRASPSIARRSLRARPAIETWSSCIALEGIESTEAGAARRLSSDTIPAAGTGRSSGPSRRDLVGEERGQSVAAGDVEGAVGATHRHGCHIGTAIARKSSTYATGAPWKLPFDSTRPRR